MRKSNNAYPHEKQKGGFQKNISCECIQSIGIVDGVLGSGVEIMSEILSLKGK